MNLDEVDPTADGLMRTGARSDDFAVEVELLKNNPEFMVLMKQLSQEKAAISLQDLRKHFGL
jgi:hypothetical protein